MNTVNIGKLPIQITDVGGDYADIKIGDIPSQIIEPKPTLLKMGIVYLRPVDFANGDWEKLIEVEAMGRKFRGFTRDPRLVELGRRVFEGRITDEDIGRIIPPLEEKSPEEIPSSPLK